MSTESNIEIPASEEGAEPSTLKQLETTTFVPGSENIPEQTVLTYPDRPADKTTIKYENGQPANIEVQSGTTNSTFTIDENGNKIPQQIIQNKGLPTQQTTNYTYGENTTEIKTVDAENKPVQIQTFDNEKGTVTTRTYGASTSDIEIYDETVVSSDSATKSEYLNGEMMSQTLITKDGKQYHADYDGNGNTKITVQENETLDKIAKNFGCSVDELKSLNPGLDKLTAGEQFIVPGKLEPDDAKLIIRKTPEQIEADKTERQNKANQRIQAEKAGVKQALGAYRGLDVNKDYGKPLKVNILGTGQTSTLTIVGGNKITGGYFLKDKDGNFYAQPTPTEQGKVGIAVPIREGGAEDFRNLPGGCTYIKHPQLGQLAELRTNDAGSKIFQDVYGNRYIQDRYDKKLVPQGKDQLQQDLSNFLDKEAVGIRKSMALLKEDQTWSEKLGEYMASSVTSKGTTAGLASDMNKYEQKLTMLRNCVNDGDTEGFKILFEDIFNVPYSEKNVKALLNAAQSGDAGKMKQLRSQTMKGDFGNMQRNFEAVKSQNEIGGYVVEGTTTLLTLGVGAELQTAFKGGQIVAKGTERSIDIAQEFGNLPESQRNLILSGDSDAFIKFTRDYALGEATGNAFNKALNKGLNKFIPDNKFTKHVKDIVIDNNAEVGVTKRIARYAVNEGKKEITDNISNNYLTS